MYGYGQTVVSLRDTRGEVTSTDVAMQHTMLRCDDRIDARYCRAATDAATDAADSLRQTLPCATMSALPVTAARARMPIKH